MGNRKDDGSKQVQTERAQKFAEDNHFIQLYETNTKDGTNIQEVTTTGLGGRARARG